MGGFGQSIWKVRAPLAEVGRLWESKFVGEMKGLVWMYQVGAVGWISECKCQIGNGFSSLDFRLGLWSRDGWALTS